MRIDGGEFSLKPFDEPPEQSINCQWEMLVMEAARVRDEVIEPAEEAESPEAAIAEPSAASRSPVPAAVPLPRSPNVGASPRRTPRKAAPPLLLEPQTEEVLVCSMKGDVLYEWQSPESDARMKLADFLGKKAAEFASLMPLGRLDRVELGQTPGRVVVKYQGETALIVRSKQSTVESAGSARAA
jgi:hypothetical protein